MIKKSLRQRVKSVASHAGPAVYPILGSRYTLMRQ